MKRIALLISLCAALGVQAKKVKFSVNMQLQIVDTGGVHITGDFQSEAGYLPGDWDPGSTPMTQEVSDTNIYSVIVDIPAFRYYEFKFVNGIHGYQQEFVPFESRVNYNFIDSRWIYVDSLSNDTQMVGAVRFGGNAPAGKNLIRFYVDMTNQTASPNGVHVEGNFQNWNPATTRMYSFDGFIYEYITYVDSGMSTEREYLFVNGNAAGNIELLAGWCQNANGNRGVAAPRDTMLPVVCYTFCAACSTVAVNEIEADGFSMAPNPADEYVAIEFASAGDYTIHVSDASGRTVSFVKTYGDSRLTISTEELSSGIYFVQTSDASGDIHIKKLVVE